MKVVDHRAAQVQRIEALTIQLYEALSAFTPGRPGRMEVTYRLRLGATLTITAEEDDRAGDKDAEPPKPRAAPKKKPGTPRVIKSRDDLFPRQVAPKKKPGKPPRAEGEDDEAEDDAAEKPGP